MPGGRDLVEINGALAGECAFRVERRTNAEVVINPGAWIHLAVGTEGIELAQLAVVIVLANGIQGGRVQLPGTTALPQRQQLSAVVNQIGIGAVGRQPADVLADAARRIVAEAAHDDFVGPGFRQVLGSAHITVAVDHTVTRERHGMQHAIAIKPVTELLPTDLVAPRADTEKGAADGIRDRALYCVERNKVIQLFVERFKTTVVRYRLTGRRP